jgi:SAM-dependent methyltransferase
VEPTVRSAAVRLRAELREGRVTPSSFTAALDAVPPRDRDEWLDVLWDVEAIVEDGPDLPRGSVPYLPCGVATVLAALERASVTSGDSFVDIGSGIGRVAFLAHLKTGAESVGIEIQPALAKEARIRAERSRLPRLRFLEGDAVGRVRELTTATVFFLYCPFGLEQLDPFLDRLEVVARGRAIRVCCVDMPPLARRWLARLPSASPELDVYRSVP